MHGASFALNRHAGVVVVVLVLLLLLLLLCQVWLGVEAESRGGRRRGPPRRQSRPLVTAAKVVMHPGACLIFRPVPARRAPRSGRVPIHTAIPEASILLAATGACQEGRR